MSKKTKGKLQMDFGTVVAIIAVILSSLSIYLQFFWKKHDLRGSLVRINQNHTDKKISGDILLINRGNQPEAVLNVRFIFDSDLHTGGGMFGTGEIGPIILKPSDAVVEHLETDLPSNAVLPEGIKDFQNGHIHIGVAFEVVEPSGHVMSNIYKFTELELKDGEIISAQPHPWDNHEPIQLLYGGRVDD